MNETQPKTARNLLAEANLVGREVEVVHEKKQDNGTSFWSEVRCRARTGNEGQSQIAHCCDEADAELIAFLINREIRQHEGTWDFPEFPEGDLTLQGIKDILGDADLCHELGLTHSRSILAAGREIMRLRARVSELTGE